MASAVPSCFSPMKLRAAAAPIDAAPALAPPSARDAAMAMTFASMVASLVAVRVTSPDTSTMLREM